MEEREKLLMSEYIGGDLENYTNSNLNWGSAVAGQAIGPIWFFYRKSYLLGFAFIVLTLIVSSIINAMGFEKAYYAMAIIYLFSTNKLYMWDVRRKIRKILANNSNKSDEEIIDIARKKGGKSILAVVLYMIGFMFLVYLIVLATIAVHSSMY
ncbi:MAG: DUF2628 domain-containing protein [Clostridia bacterium]|nr:DUF2628 domain-containing protein [Clostridia bacterium]